MRKIFQFIPTLAVLVLLAGCQKEPNSVTPGTDPAKPEEEKSPELDWNYFRGSVYLGGISSYDQELKESIETFFPLTADMSNAQVVFVGESDVKAKSPALLKAIANDAYIVFPAYDGAKDDFAALGVELDIPEISGTGYEPLLCCYNGFGQGFTYTMFGQTDFEVPQPEDNEKWSDDEWAALNEENQKLGPEADDPLEEYEWNYYESLLAAFVNWLNNDLSDQEATKSQYVVDMKGRLEDLGKRYTYSYSVNLNKTIDKDFSLNRSTTISVDIRVFPVYKQSSNGDQAGDYYIVVSKIIPYNQRMWNPTCWPYRFFCRLRAYGYWFEEMNVATSLVKKSGEAISGLNFYDTPIPENKNISKKYTEGKSFNIGGSLSSGASDKGPSAGIGLSIGGGWNSSTSYDLSTIDFDMDSSTPTVNYRYYTNEENIKLTDDWGEQHKIDKNFPSTARNQFNANTNWVWHVPSVSDNENTTFKLKNKLDITYATWYHWRAAAEFDGNKRTYKTTFPEISWPLVAPNRVPWGIVALKNASTYEMAHVTVYNQSNKKMDVLYNSFSKDQVAKIALPVGTYSVRFDLIDGTTQKKYASYVYNNVEVKQGSDERSASVQISSIDAVKE